MSPLSRVYKTGSIIYFEGDKADSVFVLQTGLVSLIYISPETQVEVRENIKSGEFFGVKSALGRFPREETAQVSADVTAMVLSVKEFEVLAMKNHKLVMKMLKVFSNQLRRIGKTIQKMLDSEGGGQEGDGLFQIGEYYLKSKKYTQATYAYQKYLTYYPHGVFATQCQQRMEMAQSGASTGYAIASDGTSFAAKPEDPPKSQQDISEALSMDGSSIDAAKQYYDAVNFFSQGRYEEALSIYTKVIQNTSNPQDEFVGKSHFDSGRCYIKLNNYQDAITAFSELIKNFPNTEQMKDALFMIGKCYMAVGEQGKAKAFLKKVVGMPPSEAVNKKAQAALAEMGGE